MRIVGISDIGSVRSENQDDFAYKILSDTDGFALVCDGMGGANGGAVASAIASKLIAERIISSYRSDMSGLSAENVLESAVAAANVEVFDAAEQNVSLKGMGTTAVAVIVLGNEAHIAHVGDSRAYYYHDNALTQITLDHSYVQDMVDKGQITEEQARLDPRKNIITRAIGVENTVIADFDTVTLVDSTDVLLLCSDGLTNMVDFKDIQHVIKSTDFEQIPQTLVNIANQNGGADNITVIAVAL